MPRPASGKPTRVVRGRDAPAQARHLHDLLAEARARLQHLDDTVPPLVDERDTLRRMIAATDEEVVDAEVIDDDPAPAAPSTDTIDAAGADGDPQQAAESSQPTAAPPAPAADPSPPNGDLPARHADPAHAQTAVDRQALSRRVGASASGRGQLNTQALLVRVRVLELFENAKGQALSLADVARELDMKPAAAANHVRGLHGAGKLARTGPTRGPGVRYRLAPPGTGMSGVSRRVDRELQRAALDAAGVDPDDDSAAHVGGAKVGPTPGAGELLDPAREALRTHAPLRPPELASMLSTRLDTRVPPSTAAHVIQLLVRAGEARRDQVGRYELVEA